MTYRIVHRTTYEYAEPVTVSHHAARLEPRTTATQQCEYFRLLIEPEPSARKQRADYFDNQACFFSIQKLHEHLEVIAESIVSVVPTTPPAPALSPAWEQVVEMFSDPVAPEVVEPYQFVFDSLLLRVSPELADYARESFRKDTPLIVGALGLTKRIHADFKFDPVATTVSTPFEEVWKHRHGVCQDFAHLAIACLRSIGLPARYVSGYLRTRPPQGKERLVGADYSHAWASAYCPGHGWVDFDPTNNLMPGEEHISVAYGRDFSDVSPLSGVLTGGGKHEVSVGVDVAPL